MNAVNQIANHLQIESSAIARCEEWASVWFVVIVGRGARFVSKKVVVKMDTTVRLKLPTDTASGGRTGWWKTVTAVDPNGTNGYAFSGDFVKSGIEVDLKVGTLLIRSCPEGSVKNGYNDLTLYRVTGESESGREVIGDNYYHYRKEFLTFRDLVATALKEQKQAPSDPLGDALKALIAQYGATEVAQKLEELQ